MKLRGGRHSIQGLLPFTEEGARWAISISDQSEEGSYVCTP